jgi:hypothetical protein
MKKIDMHFHVVRRGRHIDQVDDQVFFYPENNNTLLTKVLDRLVEKTLGEAERTLTGAARSIPMST